MNKTKSILLGATALAMFAAPQLASAQTTGAAVVFLPAPSQAPSNSTTSAGAISADGSVIVGDDDNGALTIWTNGVPEELGYFNSQGISGDGRVILGGTNDNFRRGVIWTRAGGIVYLPNPTPLVQPASPLASNFDGSVLAVTGQTLDRVGGFVTTHFQAYRWTQGGGYQNLGQFGVAPPNPSQFTAFWGTEAAAINGDGNVIAGNVFDQTAAGGSNQSAFVWTQATGLQRLPSLVNSIPNGPNFGSPEIIASVSSISRDGTTIIGSAINVNGRLEAVFWRNGQISALGFLPSSNPLVGQTDAFGINANGSIIVGRSIVGATSTAWRWTAASGMQDLNLFATNAGLNLNGFVLIDAVGISDNGQFITGNSFNATQNQYLGYVLQLAQVTQSRLIVTLRLPSVTQTSIVNQTFSTQVDALLNGQSVFTRTVADTITATSGVTALSDARAALQVGSGLRRVVVGAPTLISNTTTVTGTTSNTVDVASGTTTTTASVNTFGPTTVATGNFGTCATPAANNVNPTGCSLPGTPVTVDTGILNTNVFTNTINSVTPTITQTVNQLISARWQVSATAGYQFGTVHALVGPATFERGDQFVGQLTSGRSRRNLVSLDDVQASLFGGYSGGQSKIDADTKIPVAATKGSHDAFTIGGERRINQHLALGAAFDHGTSDIKVQDPQYGERLELKQTQVGVFGTLSSGRASLSGAASYGFGDVETTLATPTGPARASRDAKSWTLGVEGAYDVPLGSSATLALIGGARTTRADLQAFTETGGSSPLRGLGSNVDRTRIYAGFDLRGQFKAGSATIEPSLYARAAQDSGDKNGIAEVVFASTPSGPTLQALGPSVGKSVTEYGAALSATLSTNTRLTLGYDATTRDNATSSSARLGLSVAW